MDMSNFFFGSGMALFIALLAWGDQIRKQRDEIIELENDFIKKLGLKRSDMLPILRPDSKQPFPKKLCAVINFTGNAKTTATDIELTKSIKSLNHHAKHLELMGQAKYYLTIVLTVLSFSFGIITALFGKVNLMTICSFTLTLNKASFLLFIILILFVLSILYYVSQSENRFISSIDDTILKLE